MKYIIFIGLAFTLNSCDAQSEKTKKPQPVKHSNLVKQHSYSQLLKNKKMEHFDIKKFDAHKDESQNYKYTLEDGSVVEEYTGLDNHEYMRDITKKKSLFTTNLVFDPSGNLKTKGQTFKNTTELGIWTDYDEKGNLIKTTDTDKPFIITFEDIAKFCEERKADLYAYSTTIDRFYDQSTKVCTWTVKYTGEYEGTVGNYSIDIDGKTGDILRVIQTFGKHGEHKTIYDKKVSGARKEGVNKGLQDGTDNGNKGFWSSLLE